MRGFIKEDSDQQLFGWEKLETLMNFEFYVIRCMDAYTILIDSIYQIAFSLEIISLYIEII